MTDSDPSAGINPSVIFIIGTAITFLTSLTGIVIGYLREGRTRRWADADRVSAEHDRITQRQERKEDAEFLARKTQEEATKLAQTVTAQHQEMLGAVDLNTNISVAAFQEANGVNLKIARATEAIAARGRRVGDQLDIIKDAAAKE